MLAKSSSRIYQTIWEPAIDLEQKPRENAPEQAVCANEDHPTKEHARNRRYAIEWASVRKREQAQLKGYGVYSRVRKD
jgi:hypothetical protein